MEFVLIVFIIISIASGIITFIKTKDISNPATLLSFFFVIPLLFNRFKLSGLQADAWDDLTYLIIIYFLTIFIILPSVILSYKTNKFVAFNLREMQLPGANVMSILGIVAGISQFALNYLNTGFFIPSRYILLLFESGSVFHVIEVGFWGILIETYWAVIIIFCFLVSIKEESRRLKIISIIGILIPLVTRLSRLSVLVVFFVIVLALYDYTKNRKRFVLQSIVVIIIAIILGNGIMFYRWSLGGEYKVSMAESIQFKRNPGPFEIYSSLYAYFPLSIDNVDRFVRKNRDDLPIAYGAYMLRPVLVGGFKFQRIFKSYPMTSDFNELRDPIAGVATVPTAIPEFTVDFGYRLSFIPMLFYSIIGVLLFIYGRRYNYVRIFYYFFAMAYIFSSFQNYFISPKYFYYILWIFLIQIISRKRLRIV